MGKTKIEWTDEIKKRFWGYVDKTLTCWLWNAGCFQNGYGQFRLGKKKVKAHRFAYMMCFGEIPVGKIVCHRCDNKKCVNPTHLFLGTHKDNAQDREKKNRHPHLNGYDKSGANNPACKITPLIVRTIRRYRKKGHTYSELQNGVEFGFGIRISKSQVANIVHKRSWSNVR